MSPRARSSTANRSRGLLRCALIYAVALMAAVLTVRAVLLDLSPGTIRAVVMTALFALISIPMMDKHLKDRYPVYAQHKENTAALLPRVF
ncbi:MAG: hypothetical protein KOO61_06825 [Spirochaetales bacterium]|nr:hypothetical protein [Spirochaetales bacterium]